MILFKKKIHILLLLFGFIYCHLIIGQNSHVSEISHNANKEYLIECWDTKVGLEQNFVEGFYQTREGYMWILTRGGLSRFDGNVLETFSKPDHPDNWFGKAFLDNENNAWLITNTDQLFTIPNGKNKPVKFETDAKITCICESPTKDLLLGTKNGEIFVYYKLSGKLTQLLKCNNHIENLVYLNNQLFIATHNGLFVFQNNKLTEVPELKNQYIQTLRKSNEGILGYSHNGFFKIENDKFEWQNVLNTQLGKGDFRHFLIENDGKIWIPTLKGLVCFDGKQLQFYTEKDGLNSNQTYSVFRSKEGDLLVGTCNMGFNKLKTKQLRVYGKQNGMVEDVCRPVIQLKDGKVLIGHNNDITEWDGLTFKPYLRNLPGSIWTMMQDKNGKLWLGTMDSGVIVYNEKKRIKLNNPNNFKLSGIKSIYEDKRGVVWVATRSELYTYSENGFQNFLSTHDEFWITNISEDNKGRMWICSSNGLFLIQNGGLKAIGTADGISENVRGIYQDSDGVYWIATFGHGIYRYKNDVFYRFKGVGDKRSSSILEDKNGMFWISTQTGVYSVMRSDLNDFADKKSPFIFAKYHGYHDGIKNPECNGGFQNSALILPDDKFCFPSEAGLIVVDTRVERESSVPTLVIEAISKDGKTLNVSDSTQFIGDVLESVYVRFTAPYFDELNNVTFQHMLEGKDSTWSEDGYGRELNYLKLPPGNYKLKIRVYGSLNEKSIRFNVPIPYWKTLPFYILGIIIIFIFSALLIYLRIRSIKAKEGEKLKVSKEYAALELKALQGQMNPHFMFNCLNTIKYFVAIDDKDSTSKYLNKFSQLIRLFLDQSNSNQVKIVEEIKLITLYVEMEQLRLDNAFDFELNVDDELINHGYKMPTIILQPFVENAIHHGLRALTTHKGILKISFLMQDNHLKITIDDNGIGRKKAMDNKNNKDQSRKSVGIKNVFERLEFINYIRSSYVSLAIIDKPENQQGETGTIVELTIPLTDNLSELNQST